MRRVFILVVMVVFMLLGTLSGFCLDTDLKVYDEAGLFTREELDNLRGKAQKIAGRNQMDVVVVTINDSLGKSSMNYADDFFDYNGFGYGKNDDGILLLIDMDNRKVWISTHAKGIAVYTDAIINKILDKITGHLTDGKYYRAADIFLNQADLYAANGFRRAAKHIPVYLLISVAVAGISVGVMAIHNKGRKTITADTYLDRDSIRLRDNRDIYIRTAVTKRAINTSSGGGGGGSSTHRSSSGRSHGGGGRSF